MKYSLLLTLLLTLNSQAQTVNRTFYRDICLQRYVNGQPTETFMQRSRLFYDDKGGVRELILFRQGKVKGMSERDIRDFTSTDFAKGRYARPKPQIAQFFRDYGHREYKVDVVVKDEFDDALRPIIFPKERKMKCFPN